MLFKLIRSLHDRRALKIEQHKIHNAVVRKETRAELRIYPLNTSTCVKNSMWD